MDGMDEKEVGSQEGANMEGCMKMRWEVRREPIWRDG
jgi:hypothetical protein